MTDELYRALANHLDRLPGGFPPTETGVELSILRRLFTPEEAALAVHVTLLPEDAAVIARRAGLPVEETADRLSEMAAKGLIYDLPKSGRPVRYSAASFVIGIWEFQLNRLNPGLIHDVDEFFKLSFPYEVWSKAPQLRTVPIGASLPTMADVLPYERAEQLIQAHHKFSLAECICRKERHMIGEGCDKPMEACLGLGSGAEFYIRHGLAREITRDEALQVIEMADRTGLVLQPTNSMNATAICCCCGDCCGVLRNVRRHPHPSSVVSSGYYAESDPEICSACGDCLQRCQMDAITVNGASSVDQERCIGCGLCVTSCSTGAMHLVRKPQEEQRHVPKDFVDANLYLARTRGVLGTGDLVKMAVRSTVDRALAGHAPVGEDKGE